MSKEEAAGGGGGEAEEGGGGGGWEYTTKNKNPTQRCAEKNSRPMGYEASSNFNGIHYSGIFGGFLK